MTKYLINQNLLYAQSIQHSLFIVQCTRLPSPLVITLIHRFAVHTAMLSSSLTLSSVFHCDNLYTYSTQTPLSVMSAWEQDFQDP